MEEAMVVLTLIRAAARGADDFVTAILTEHPGALNASLQVTVGQAKRRWTALHAASFSGHPEVVVVLMALGADLDVTDDEGETPLVLAVEKEHGDVVTLLLKRGARMDTRTVHGFTVMINAAANNQADMVRLLLAHGGRQYVDETDGSGRTALYWAAKNGGLKTTKMLLSEGGADPFKASHSGMTPQEAARRSNRTQCYDLFKHIERAVAVFKARRVHDDAALSRLLPTAPLSSYYRRDANAPVAAVSIVGDKGSKVRKASSMEVVEAERHDTVDYVVSCMADGLFRELMDGLRLLA